MLFRIVLFQDALFQVTLFQVVLFQAALLEVVVFQTVFCVELRGGPKSHTTELTKCKVSS